MFETVAPETFHTRSKKLSYETLPVSVAVHGLAIASAVVAALWNVTFPEASPRVSVAYSLTHVPDPPPPPPPPPQPKAAAPRVETPKPAPPPPPILLGQITAPTVIPDRIPEVVEPPPADPTPPPAVTETGAGDPHGSKEGQLGGEIGGKIGGKAGGVAFPDDGRMHIALGENLPLKSVEQEYPRYPDEARKKRLEDQVVVRYIIGTDGRVKDVQILDHAKEKMFDEAAVDAIRKWRFRPMIKEGKAVEVEHDLAVNFEMIIR